VSLPVAILAGGVAMRLRPVTERIPKSLVDVAGLPFAVHQIDLLRCHGLTDIVFLVGYLGAMIQDSVGDGAHLGVRVRYVFDGPRPLGTGGAIRMALPELGDAFFVLYGDSYLACDYDAVERAFANSRKAGLMTVCRNDDRWDRSNVLFVNGRIVAYDKQRQVPAMHHIDYGLGAFRRSAFENRSENHAFDLAEVYQDLLAGSDLAGFEVSTRFYEIGSHSGLEETRSYLAGKEGEAR
jgi:NDP-sugar pyrophosphorylase family protein